MMIGDRKEEGRVCLVLSHIIWKKPDVQRELIDSNSEQKKPKSVQGFKPGLLGVTAMALPLVPPPWPLIVQNKLTNHALSFGNSCSTAVEHMPHNHDVLVLVPLEAELIRITGP